MSVHAKDRRETATQYIITAQYLQIAVIKNMMNEKKVPKKWRYLFAYSVIKKVNELLDNVIASEKTFPNNEEKLEKRKGFLNAAVINCYQLENKLLCMIRCIDTVTVDNLKDVTSLLFDEVQLLKKCLKNARIVGSKEV